MMDQYREQCELHNHPAFIPANGRCICGYDFTKGGTVVPYWGTTGCPECHRSFCD